MRMVKKQPGMFNKDSYVGYRDDYVEPNLKGSKNLSILFYSN